MMRLTRIWDDIGITGDQRVARKGVVLLHLRNLLDEMVNEEELLKSRLVGNIEKFTVDLSQLAKELGVPLYKVDIWISFFKNLYLLNVLNALG